MLATRRALIVIAATCLGPGCARELQPDAYGNVEATEVVVGAETGGRLVRFEPEEGGTLAEGTIVAAVDATPLELERDQLAAQRDATASRLDEISRQIEALQAERSAAVAEGDAARSQRAALEAQHEIARRTYERLQRLFAEQAATAQQLDQAESEARVADLQLAMQDDVIRSRDARVEAQERQIQTLRAQQQTVRQQLASAAAQVARAADRIARSEVANPQAGTVLATYAKAGEVVQVGQPLYRIANLEVVEVRAYVTQPQLAGLSLGGAAEVSIDAGNERRVLMGTVSWIASEAQFTPTPVQTREERADLVYAVKIRVPNPEGVLKIGMPVDVQFSGSGSRP
jgi:HlyD family secretion protein